MSQRTTVLLVVSSHLLLAAAGFWLAGHSTGSSDGDFSRPVTGAREDRSAADAADFGKFRAPGEWRGSEYARAWKAVANGRHTVRERIRLQRDLLEKWAEVDLAAAIEAALSQEWDADGAGDFDAYGPLLDVFAPALARRPQEGWEMIRGRQFGVGTGILRRVWMEAVGRQDPGLLAARLAELSWRDREQAMEICGAAVRDGAPTTELFTVLAASPPELIDANQLLTFAPPPAAADTEKLKDDIARLAVPDPRLATVKAILLGRQLAAKSTDEIAAEIESLPDGLREEALWAAFKETDQPENVLGLLDLFIEEEAWPRLEDPETLRQIQQLARAGDALIVAEWAVTLPIRPETTGLFHRSVESYFREDRVAARDWIDALPPGTWRDRALAGYSQVALHDHNDPQASRRALQQISDSDLRTEAESWRTQWGKRTGPAEK